MSIAASGTGGQTSPAERKTLMRHVNAKAPENRKSPLDRTVKSCEGAFIVWGGIQMAGLSMLPLSSVSARKLFALAASKVIPPRLWSDFASER